MIVLHFPHITVLYRNLPGLLKYIRYPINLGICRALSQGLLGCFHLKGLKAAGTPGPGGVGILETPPPLPGVAAHFLDLFSSRFLLCSPILTKYIVQQLPEYRCLRGEQWRP